MSAMVDLAAETNLPWYKCLLCSKVGEGGSVVCFLPCMHFLCAEPCVENFHKELEKQDDGNKTLQCKTCLLEFSSVTDLTEKVVLQKFLPKKPTPECINLCCGWCVLKNRGEKFCPDCNIYLCQTCTEYHRILRKTFTHMVDDITGEMVQAEFERFMETRSNCELHDETEYESFCFTCQKKMCSFCCPDHTESHTILMIAETTAAAQKNFEFAKKIVDEARSEILKLEGERLSLSESEPSTSSTETEHVIEEEITDQVQPHSHEKHQLSGRRKKQILDQIIRLRSVIDVSVYYQTILGHVTLTLDDIGILNFSIISQKLLERVMKSKAMAKLDSSVENVRKTQGQLQSSHENVTIVPSKFDETRTEQCSESKASSTLF